MGRRSSATSTTQRLPPRRSASRLRRPHGHRQNSFSAPARAPAHHGLPLLGHRVSRRLPLRPRRHAGPPVPRGDKLSPLHESSSRTRHLPGQAHSEPGTRRGGSRSELPGLGRWKGSTETPSATSGARPGHAGKSRRVTAHYLTSTAAASERRSIHTAPVPFTLRDSCPTREAQRGTASGNDGEGHNRRGPCGRRSRETRPHAATAPAPQPPHDPAALAGRADDQPR